MSFVFTELAELYAVCRLPPAGAVPDWATEGQLWSATRTPDELSLICAQRCVPDGVRAESDWRVLRLEGPLEFSQVGVLAGIASTLSRRGISLLALSTFDTDYVLVKRDATHRAADALRDAGHRVNRA